MAIRVRPYDFIVGVETSTLPDPGTPSAANDTISLGYLEDMSYWAEPVASYAAMRALTTTQRKDNQRRVVDATQEIWYFDGASTSVDDGATILEPDDSPVSGRWLLQAGGGGGGGGGGGSGIDQVLQKLEMERYSIHTTPVENSGGLSGFVKPTHKLFEANLLKDYVSGAAAMEVVWNGVAVNSSDKNYDSSTGWVAGVGSSVTSIGTTSTAGQFTVGTAAIKWDKTSASTTSGLRYDIGAQTLSLVDQTRVWVYVYMPSVTGLTNIYLAVYADSTSNYQLFTATTNYAGGALAVGLNLLSFDISTGGTATGTGWDVTKLARYVEIGVTTSSAGQTYTGIAFDALYFSYRYPNRLRVIGSEFTVFDNSVRSDIKAATSNTLHDGPLTLSATVASNIAGGLSGTSRGRVMRSSLLIEGDGLMIMDNDAGLSGAITTTQDVRTGFLMRESVAGTMPVVIDALATQAYPVTAVGGSTIDVTDTENTVANLLSGDAIDVFRPYYIDGVAKYVLHAALSLSANASHSSGVSTLTLTTTGIQVGDIACKRHVNTVGLSMVTESALENFSTLSLDTAPDGVQLVETGLNYPNSQYVYAHWTLGGNTSLEATRNRRGPGPALTVAGTLNYGNNFKNGQQATTGWNGTTNWLQIPSADSGLLDADSSVNTRLQYSFWINFASTGTTQAFMSRDGGGDQGYYLQLNSGGNLLLIVGSTPQLTIAGAISPNIWYHMVSQMEDGAVWAVYINGTRYVTGAAVTFAAVARNFAVSGYGSAASVPMPSTTQVADIVVWRNGPALTASQVQELYNQGQHRIVGSGPLQRYQYTATGQTGQRATVKARLTRTTTAIRPIISKIGTIVT